MSQCNHKRCDGAPCKALPPEALEYDDETKAYAEQLVADGWKSVSSKHRRIARMLSTWPSFDELVKDEYKGTAPAEELRGLWERHERWCLRVLQSRPLKESEPAYIEEKTLTLKQFRAFKHAGGESA